MNASRTRATTEHLSFLFSTHKKGGKRFNLTCNFTLGCIYVSALFLLCSVCVRDARARACAYVYVYIEGGIGQRAREPHDIRVYAVTYSWLNKETALLQSFAPITPFLLLFMCRSPERCLPTER